MTQEIAQCSQVVLQLLREGQRLSDQTRHSLAQGVVQPLDMAGLTALFAHGSMPLLRQNTAISFPVVGVADGTLAVHSGQ